MILYDFGYLNFKNQLKARQAKKWIATLAKNGKLIPSKEFIRFWFG